METGRYEKCEGGFTGIFDIIGNVNEIIYYYDKSVEHEDELAFEHVGGNYKSEPGLWRSAIVSYANCVGDGSAGREFEYDYRFSNYTGFRCCSDL